MLTTRLFLLATFLSAALTLHPFAVADDRPNLILLMGDDHGWSETGYNGHPHVQTPVLDQMAASGLRLDHFYSGHPTCSPTRGSFLTGRHPNRYGTFQPNFSIRLEEITIAHLLSKAGYQCGHFGKWHLGPVKAGSPTNPHAMGFDHFVSHDNFYEMDPVLSENGQPPRTFPGEGSKVTIDETIKFIDRAHQSGKPFLAVVWFGSPHEPYSGLPEDLAKYDDLPAEYSERTVRLTSMETGRPATRSLREVLRERYAEITAMDRAIGELRQHLTDKNLRENTMLWYCGDNGSPPSSGRVATPFRGEKALMYEGGIRVPGLIEWPARIPEGRVSKLNAVTSDILPTLCQLVGVAPPERPLDGVSLARLIDGTMEQRDQPICFWQYDVRQLENRKPALEPYIDPELQRGTTPLVKYMAGKLTRSFTNFHHPPIGDRDYVGPRVILDGHHKLVVGQTDADSVELFDLWQDPAEEQNLAETQPELADRLGERLHQWQTSVLASLAESDYSSSED
ncbi:sulfatase-like hydrolase/transferase [Roseiconus nitratireducens]|uniref:Sulfatase-like hydrolase/transferase n=1 Tax=Roseiconus nitratireducens TaxID=2605748 RepID=A0A5M6DGN1_9BACT|nr:sulfatase-like hydrolase/transferase [Roseiconus nitratireducens]KAA5545440.1 sulfatase-like hydrolase/transferase [Roseiconus nitratireducens]